MALVESLVSYMVKLEGYPRLSENSLRKRMKTEWKVPMKRRLAFLSPTIRAILSFISEAAFLVNVRASILSGSQPFSSMYAILLVSTLVFPEPAPATISTGPSIQLTARLCSLFSPSNIVFALFSIMGANIRRSRVQNKFYLLCRGATVYVDTKWPNIHRSRVQNKFLYAMPQE